MNFSQILLEYLKKQGSVCLASFGTFSLQTTPAALDAEGKSLLPPGMQISFRPDCETTDTAFLQFISGEKSLTLSEAALFVRQQTGYWNAALEKDKTLIIEELGTFYLEDSHLHFKGKRVEAASPAFFGLEEINLSEVRSTRKSGSSYGFGKVLLWTAIVAGLAAAIAYFTVMQPELLFGKKSFESVPPAPQVATPVVQDTLKTDTLSLIQDSAAVDSTAVATPAKKWKPKKKKWKK